MSIQERILLFIIGWGVIMGGIFVNRFLVFSTGIYYFPTISLITYLILLCLGLKDKRLIIPILLFLTIPLTLLIDTLLGAAVFGYYATGFLLGNMCFFGSLLFINIHNESTQLINIFIFLVFFWIMGPAIFINFISHEGLNYNFLIATIHLIVDFCISFFVVKIVIAYLPKNV
jgi:hypothetical protein